MDLVVKMREVSRSLRSSNGFSVEDLLKFLDEVNRSPNPLAVIAKYEEACKMSAR